MAASFVRFAIAASLLMAQHQLTMCLSADDFIVIADPSADEVYYTEMSAAPDFSKPLTFTPSLTLLDPIRVDYDCVDQKIYLTDKGENVLDKFVASFNTDGSAANKVITDIPDTRPPYGIQVDEVNRRFFWTAASDGGTDGGVFVTDMAGTTTDRLTSGATSPNLENVVLDEKEGDDCMSKTEVFRKKNDTSAYRIRFRDDCMSKTEVFRKKNDTSAYRIRFRVLYIADSADGTSGIFKVNTDGTELQEITSAADKAGKDDFTGIAIDDDKVYWSDSDNNFIGSANKDGSNFVTFPTKRAYQPEDMVVYYNNLYFVDKSFDALYRMPKDGSAEPVAVSFSDGNFENPRGLHIEFTPPCITDTLDLTVVSANELDLSWTPDNEVCYDKCEADEYQVSFQPYDVQTCSVSDSNVYQMPWQPTSLTTLDNLVEDTYYQMKITSRNLPADGQDPYEGNSVYIVEPCIADDLTVEQISSNELSVSWSATECECRADEFQVSYTTLDHCNVEASDVLPWQTSTSAILPSFSQLSSVTVTVSYRKMYGETLTEGRLPLTYTLSDITSAPTGPPSDVSVSSVGANDLVMTWSDIPCDESGGAEVTEYQYELESRYGTTTGSTTSPIVTFPDLNCGTEYSFRVKAITMGGIGPFSEYFVVQTLMSKEPFASELSVSPVLGRNEILWESAECPPESFDVDYTLILRDQCEAVTLSTNRLQVPESAVTLDNLLPFSTYMIEVTGTGSSGATVTRSIPLVTHESAPSAPPINLHQVVTNEASELEFSWQPPSCGSRHGVIVNYQYEYSYQSMSRIGTTSSTSVKLEGLNSNTDYEFRVAAITSAGIGPYSNEVLVKTDGQCPFDYCLNGGTCFFNELSEVPSCSCTNSYFGMRCDLSPTLPLAETTPLLPAQLDDGIGPGAIAAIATSLVIGVGVTSVAVAIFFYLLRSRSDSAQVLTRAGPAANYGLGNLDGGGGNWILQ